MDKIQEIENDDIPQPTSTPVVPTTNAASLRASLYPLYHKWITGVFPTHDFRYLVNKCTTFSTMLITSKYISPEHPFGLGKILGKKFPDVDDEEEGKKDKKDKKDKKGKKDKKDKKDKKGKKDKDKDKDKKDKKGKKDKDKDKKGKKDKDKDKKDKKDKGKDKKDKKDKDKDKKDKGKDKKDKKKDKKDKKDKGKDKKDKKDKKKDKGETVDTKIRSVKDLLLRREGESLSVFAPCMKFVRCPTGAAGEECQALKKAANASFSADKCWFSYMEQLSKCDDKKGKDCLKKLRDLEDSCKRFNQVSQDHANTVLGASN